MPRSVRELLGDMLTYSARCQPWSAGKSYLAYCNDTRTRLAVERLGIVREALIQAVKLDPLVLTYLPDGPRIMNLRHRLIHDYHNVDDAIIWSVVEDHLPGMQLEVTNLIGQMPFVAEESE